MKSTRVILIAVGALFVGISVFFLGLQAYEAQQTFKGSAIGTPAPQALDFELQKPDGSPFRLSEQKGKVVLIYLGFTNCEDACPAAMGKYKQIAEELGEDATLVDFVFVTVDPDRDSSEVIDAYLHLFNPSFVGLTGSLEELLQVWTFYGSANPIKVDVVDENTYEVTHGNRIWVIDKEGLWRLTFPEEMSAEDMTHDVRLLLDE
ncbi:MAG: SCO family protein [Anaerolineales bacterium]